jgi:hypothetical protein
MASLTSVLGGAFRNASILLFRPVRSDTCPRFPRIRPMMTSAQFVPSEFATGRARSTLPDLCLRVRKDPSSPYACRSYRWDRQALPSV